VDCQRLTRYIVNIVLLCYIDPGNSEITEIIFKEQMVSSSTNRKARILAFAVSVDSFYSPQTGILDGVNMVISLTWI
jgi:hypothetical protein